MRAASDIQKKDPRLLVLRSQYVPSLCCAHDWVGTGMEKLDEKGRLLEYREICQACGSTCVRNGAGAIEEYDVPLAMEEGEER